MVVHFGIFTNYVTKSMEKCSYWDLSTYQEISLLLWNPKVNFFVYKGPLLGPFMREMNPHRTPTH